MPRKASKCLSFPGNTAFYTLLCSAKSISKHPLTGLKSLRSLALIHGVLSFCFNTIILALTINTVSGLLYGFGLI